MINKPDQTVTNLAPKPLRHFCSFIFANFNKNDFIGKKRLRNDCNMRWQNICSKRNLSFGFTCKISLSLDPRNFPYISLSFYLSLYISIYLSCLSTVILAFYVTLFLFLTALLSVLFYFFMSIYLLTCLLLHFTVFLSLHNTIINESLYLPASKNIFAKSYG